MEWNLWNEMCGMECVEWNGGVECGMEWGWNVEWNVIVQWNLSHMYYGTGSSLNGMHSKICNEYC